MTFLSLKKDPSIKLVHGLTTALNRFLAQSAQTYTEIGTEYFGMGLYERNWAAGFDGPLPDVFPPPYITQCFPSLPTAPEFVLLLMRQA